MNSADLKKLGSARWWNGLRTSTRIDVLKSFGIRTDNKTSAADLSYNKLKEAVQLLIDDRFLNYLKACERCEKFLAMLDAAKKKANSQE